MLFYKQHFYKQHQAEIGENETEYDMLVSIMQHLNNVWSSSHEKVKQYWVWEEKKSVTYKKSMYIIHQRCKINNLTL